MGLGEHRQSTIRQTLDEIQLPLRPAGLERAVDQPCDQVGELTHPARRRQRGATDVETQIEVRVVDPHRAGEAEGDLADPLPEPRRVSQPGVDELENTIDVPRLVPGDQRQRT